MTQRTTSGQAKSNRRADEVDEVDKVDDVEARTQEASKTKQELDETVADLLDDIDAALALAATTDEEVQEFLDGFKNRGGE